MKSDFTDFHKLRKYLLRGITDEIELDSIEKRMLSDGLFLAEIDRVETELIEEYLDQTLDPGERELFEKYFLAAPQRKTKFRFMLALKESAAEYAENKAVPPVTEGVSASKRSRGLFLNGLFASGAFKLAAAGLWVVVVAAGLLWYFSVDNKVSEGLAALKTAYPNQRPTEVRLSAFDYAPLIDTRGGGSVPVDGTARDQAGYLLTAAVREKPGAEAYRALGLFYASQRNFDAALDQFDKGLAFAPSDAQFYADYGAVLLETAKNLPGESAEKRLRYLEKSLTRLDFALKSNSAYLPALFNRALCLQEMHSAAAAREAWQKYLEKDPSSKWADEARGYLKQLDEKDTGAKNPAEVLKDFLLAFDRDDAAEAWKIAGESKEMVTGTMISEQLTRGLLSADAPRAPNDADRMLSALQFLGKLEKENAGDNFFSELADYYRQTGTAERAKLSQAQSLTTEGYELCRKGEYLEALSKFTESRKLFAQTRDLQEAAKTDYWISYCQAKVLNRVESLKISNSLADYSRGKSYKWLLGQALTQSGSTYIIQSKFSLAINSDKEALQLAQDTSDAYNRQKTFAQLADVYTQLNEPAGALENSQKSLRENGSYFNSPRQTWRNYMFAAQVSQHFGLGESAVAYALESVRLSRESLNDPASLHDSFLFLSAAYKTTKDYDDSLKAAEESARLAADFFAPGPTQKSLMADSLQQQGEAQRMLGDYVEAIDSYGRAIDLYREQDTSETLINYFAWKGKLLCYKKLGQEENVEADLPATLALAERLRAKIEEEYIKTSFFSDEQNIYEFAAEHALKKDDTDAAFNYIENGKARSLLDDLRYADASSASSAPGPGVTNVRTLQQIREQLPAGSQLVQYAVLPDKLLIWVVTDSNVRYVEKDISGVELNSRVREFMEYASHAGTDRGKFNELSAGLYSVLLQPIQPFLDKEKTIDIVPDKILCYLPFEALRSPEGRYAIQDYRLSYAPSATLFVMLSQTAAKRFSGGSEESFVGVGNPAFDRAKNPGLANLPAAEDEIRASAAFYRRGRKFIGPDAIKKDLLAAIPGADVFHFAGHFRTNELSPQFSKFLLASNSLTDENDLTAAEIGGLKLNRTRLVVLSACKTAIENYYHGEGAIGIARTFFAAGVPIVVASRWEVDTRASAALMTSFHRNRKEKGLSIPAALRAAQLELLSNESFDSPYYWAAFAAVGGLEKL